MWPVSSSRPHTPSAVRDRTQLSKALRDSTVVNGWIRGMGYFEAVAGELDRYGLDCLYSAEPVQIQHRSGAMWILNSAAVEATGLDTAEHPGVERDHNDRPTGRVWRADAWLRERIPSTGPPAMTEVGIALSRAGVTRVTDATLISRHRASTSRKLRKDIYRNEFAYSERPSDGTVRPRWSSPEHTKSSCQTPDYPSSRL
jgi:predicted amidohydrolase YtcJ